MRDIKFRQFYDGKMRMMDQTFVGVGQLGFSDEHYIDLGMHDKEDSSIMQYTGLKDNHSAEVYEGDIVKIGAGYKASVYWDDRSARFLLNPIGAGVMSTRSIGALPIGGRVIGNIYENPELLK